MPRKSTKKRAVKRPPKPRLLRYGYWDYPDPEPRIRRLLAKKPELLAEFDALMHGEDEENFHSMIAGWSRDAGVPAKVREIVARAKPQDDLEYFDEVEVATGSLPDTGGMVDGPVTLYARRLGGEIVYRTNGEVDAPDPTTKPLSADEVFDLIVCDPDFGPDELAGYALEGEDAEGTPDEVAEAVMSWGTSASFDSRFYDVEGHWDSLVEAAAEVARVERAAESEE